MASVTRSEQPGLHGAGPVGERKKFHRFTVDLLVGPLLDDQPTDNHLLADELAKPYDRTVTVPCDFWI